MNTCPNTCDHDVCIRRRPKPLTDAQKTRAIEGVCLRLAHRFRIELAPPAGPTPPPPPRRAV